MPIDLVAEYMLASTNGSCGVCQKPANLQCAGCVAVSYCSREHQRENWSQHRSVCRAFVVRTSPELGRYIVASRDLKEDEVILSEEPFVIGPCSPVTNLTCIGCSVALSEYGQASCPGCHWPACSRKCSKLKDPAHHGGVECKALTSASVAFGGETVMLLRCWLIRQRNPNIWKWIEERAPFAEAKLFDPDLKDEFLINVTRPKSVFSPERFPDMCVETLKRISAVKDIFGLELPTRSGDLHALYTNASLLQHSCAPNTRLSFDDGNRIGHITVKAVQNIPKGQMLTWTLTCPLEQTFQRLRHLSEKRNMVCSCARCLDPTELGTNISTLKCPLCSGWVCFAQLSPPSPLHELFNSKYLWICGDCGLPSNPALINAITNSIMNRLEATQSEDDIGKRISVFDQLLKESMSITHPNNNLNLVLKYHLLLLYAKRDLSTAMSTLSTKDLKIKADLGEDILTILDKFGKCAWGVEELTAECLSEVAVAKAELTVRRLESAEVNAVEAKVVVEACCAMLQRAVKLLTVSDNSQTERFKSISSRLHELQSVVAVFNCKTSDTDQKPASDESRCDDESSLKQLQIKFGGLCV